MFVCVLLRREVRPMKMKNIKKRRGLAFERREIGRVGVFTTKISKYLFGNRCINNLKIKFRYHVIHF